MPFVLILVGLGLAWLDYQGASNLTAAGSLLKQEFFSGSDPFYKWAGALIIIGAIGYVPELRQFSVAMLVLVVLAIALGHSGAVAQLEQAL